MFQPELYLCQIPVSVFLVVPFLCSDSFFPFSNFGVASVSVYIFQSLSRRPLSIFVVHPRGPWVVIQTPFNVTSSKLLRIIKNAPWYVTYQTLHSDLRIQCVTSVRDEYTRKHRSTLVHHQNPVVKALLLYNHQARRLKRRWNFDAIS